MKHHTRTRTGAAFAVLGLAVLTAACNGDGGGQRHTSGSEPDANYHFLPPTVKICELADLEPLKKTMKATYAQTPRDLGLGYSVEPAGLSCDAQMKPPRLRSSRNTHFTVESGSGAIKISAVASANTAKAADWFPKRLAFRRDIPGVSIPEPVPLKGPWDQGAIIVTTNDSHLIYVTVRKDNLILTIDLVAPKDHGYYEKLPFNRADLKAQTVHLMGTFYAALMAKVGH